MVGAGLIVANCGATSSKIASKVDPKYGVTASPRVVAFGEPVPKGGGAYRVGKPYQVAGRTYVPTENVRYKSEGVASWYGEDFHGRLTANGEVFDMESIAAAHPTLPMPCYVRITNLGNGRSMIVRVNDRGPYHSDRVIDVSQKAADLLGFKARGTARVRVEYAGRAPLEGSDDRQLAMTLRQDGVAPLPSNNAVMVASAAPTATSRIPIADVPVPAPRPFEFYPSAEVAMAAPAPRAASAIARVPAPAVAAAPIQRAPVAPASAPVPRAPAPTTVVAAAAASATVAPPRPAIAPAPVAVAAAKPQKTPTMIVPPKGGAQVATASMAPPAPRPAAPALNTPPQAAGWIVGPQPVANHGASVTPVSTGSGLY